MRTFRVRCEAEDCDLDEELAETEYPRKLQWEHSQEDGHSAVMHRTDRGGAA